MKSGKKAVFTVTLIILNVAIFLIPDVTDLISREQMLLRWAMFRPACVEDGEWFRLFTACFLHFGIEHLAGNMLALGALGYRLEERLGHLQFLLLYLFSGVGANLFSMWINYLQSDDLIYAAGASGAIFGIFGGLLALFLIERSRIDGVGLPQMIAAVLFLLYSGSKDGSVDMFAHLGGLAIGLLIGLPMALIAKWIRKRN